MSLLLRWVLRCLAIVFIVIFSYGLIKNSQNIVSWLIVFFSLIALECLIPSRYPNIRGLISNFLEVILCICEIFLES